MSMVTVSVPPPLSTSPLDGQGVKRSKLERNGVGCSERLLVKRLSERAILPRKATPQAAGYDLHR